MTIFQFCFFLGQIGNLSPTLSDGAAQIYVSQPGGNCCCLKACVSVNDPALETKFEPPVYHDPISARSRNPTMMAKVVGGVCFDEEINSSPRNRHRSAVRGHGAYAIC